MTRFATKARLAAVTVGALVAGAVSLVGATAASAGTPAATPAYYPSGPQLGVAVSTVTSGGWKLCFQDTYATNLHAELPSLLNACTGTYLMLAGRATNSGTLSALAAAPRADVLYDTGGGQTTTHLANGTNWYFHDNFSWGFAGANEGVNLNQCDYQTSGADRLCWHTLSGVGGYRLGDITGLNGSTSYQRLVFEYDRTQTINYSSSAPANAVVGGHDYTVAATGGASGNDVTYSIDDASNGACTIDGATVSFVHAGTCTVDANQLGNDDYDGAAQQQQTFGVGQGSQTVDFTSIAPTAAVVGSDTYDVAATGGASGNDVTYSIDDASAGACTIDGATVSFVHAGTCTVDANQLGNDDYTAAAQQQQAIGVGQGSQTVNFTSTAPTDAVVGGPTYDVTTDGGGASNNTVTYAIDDASAGACTIDGATVSFVHAGTCTVDANQLGNDDYTAATQTQSFDVGQGAQAIGFSSAPPTSALPGATYDVAADGGASNNDVTYSIAAGSTDVCSIDNAKVTFDHAGSCEIDANQAGNDDYAAATQATQTITVGKFGQTVEFSSTAPSGAAAVVGATYDVSAIGGHSDSPVTFSLVQPSDGSCTLGGSTVTFVHPGSCGVAADQAGASDYSPAATAVQNIAVSQASTTTSVTVSPTQISATVAAVAPGAGTPSGTVTFSVGGAKVGDAAVSNGVATLAYAVPAGATRSVAALYHGDTDFLGSSDSTSRNDPTITATVSSAHAKTASGWYRSPVTVTFHCTPNGAALVGTCPAPVMLGRNGAGQSVTRSVSAADGGMATKSVTGIAIDMTKPAVRIAGVGNGAHYGGTAPKATCVAKDRLSGVASCRLSRTVSGDRVRWSALATDRAGNTSTAHTSYTLLPIYLQGVRYSRGAFAVRAGHSYTLVVTGTGSRPVFYDAAVHPRRPVQRDNAFRAAGHHRWVLGVEITRNLKSHPKWNLGVRIGKTMHLVPIRVS